MSKQEKPLDTVEKRVESDVNAPQQAVDFEQNFANERGEDVVNEAKTNNESVENQAEAEVVETAEKPTATEKVVVQKSGGKGLALVALLVALAVGGAGHYFANQKFTEVETQIQALAQNGQAPTAVEMPTFEAEKAQLAELAGNYQKALERISQLEREQSGYTQQINNLQLELQKVSNISGSDKTLWLLSDADFLLNNAARKVVLDNDIDTAKSLLLEADQVLAQVPSATHIRESIKADLNTLTDINNVDQNALMQRVANLTNKLDDLPILETEKTESSPANGEVSDSIDDWKTNLEKSASSFLDHFIRVSKRNVAEEKAFVAPDQEIYLRENIRLRLQIAILAVPRQQNELYKKSLQTVGAWVRSYFDTTNENVNSFLKEVDELAEQTVYVDAPDSLQSLKALEQLMNKAPQPIEKVEIKAEKALDQAGEKAPEQPQTPTAQ